MGSRFSELIVDAANPDRLAQFWMAVLGWQPTGRYPAPLIEIAGPAQPEGRTGPSITFVPVPDEKRGKNRLHIDVSPVGCDQDAEVARLLGLGAQHADVGQSPSQSFIVLADPEGNEFCVLRDRVD